MSLGRHGCKLHLDWLVEANTWPQFLSCVNGYWWLHSHQQGLFGTRTWHWGIFEHRIKMMCSGFPSVLATYVLIGKKKNVSSIPGPALIGPEAQKDSSPSGLNPLVTSKCSSHNKAEVGLLFFRSLAWLISSILLYGEAYKCVFTFLSFPLRTRRRRSKGSLRPKEPTEGNQFI